MTQPDDSAADLPDLRLGRLTSTAAGELLTLRVAAGACVGATHSQVCPTQALAEVKAELADPTVTVLGAWAGDRLVGTIAARIDGQQADLDHFAVVPDLQGRGLGTQVLLAVPSFLPPAVTVFQVAAAAESTTAESGAAPETRELTLATLRNIAAQTAA